MAIELFDIILLIFPLVIILIGCELFTNGIEWLGVKLGLAESATGSVLAAVGTALPETIVPIIAIVFAAGGAGSEIAEGAILGAPFMLSTLAMFVGGIAILYAVRKGKRGPVLNVEPTHVMFDIKWFVVAYLFAIAAAFVLQGESDIAHVVRYIVAIFLLILYVFYVRKMMNDDESKKCEEPEHLHFTKPFPELKAKDPTMAMTLIQVAVSLGMIILGARIFVTGIENVSTSLGIPNIILAFLIAPIATELPEKFNSVLWYIRSKDTLALGNITGAMVFQSSIPISIGLIFTHWTLGWINIVSMFFAIAAISLIFLEIRYAKRLTYRMLLMSGIFYFVYISLVILFPTGI